MCSRSSGGCILSPLLFVLNATDSVWFEFKIGEPWSSLEQFHQMVNADTDSYNNMNSDVSTLAHKAFLTLS